MGTHLLHLPLFATPLNPIPSTPSTRTSTSPLRRRHHLHVPIPIRRFRFSRWDNAESDYDDDFEFGFGSSAKKRNWWSDDDWEVDEDDDDDDEFWVFKVLKAFGWMVPAVAISLVLGTGPNAFLMALAVPLGQTVLSLAFDKMWGTAVNSPKPRRKSKKKPFGNAARTRKRQDEKWESNSRGRGNSRSRSAASFDKSVGEDDKNVTGFGGWDELDEQLWTKKVPRNQKVNESSKQQKGSKLSRRGRVRETPLLLRLLVAVFPFLGSWTKLLL